MMEQWADFSARKEQHVGVFPRASLPAQWESKHPVSLEDSETVDSLLYVKGEFIS